MEREAGRRRSFSFRTRAVGLLTYLVLSGPTRKVTFSTFENLHLSASVSFESLKTTLRGGLLSVLILLSHYEGERAGMVSYLSSRVKEILDKEMRFLPGTSLTFSIYLSVKSESCLVSRVVLDTSTVT